MEAPEIIPILVENKYPSGPFGAKEAGVGVILSPAPAIANAVYNASGVMVKEFPITPETILKGTGRKDKVVSGHKLWCKSLSKNCRDCLVRRGILPDILCASTASACSA